MSQSRGAVALCTLLFALCASAHARPARDADEGKNLHGAVINPSRANPGREAGESVEAREPRSREPRTVEDQAAVIDPSAPATVMGQVHARTDGQGRLQILVDEWTQGGSPDGRYDRLFVFQSERAIENRIDERVALASVVFRNTSLYVTSAGGAFVLDLAVGTETASRRTIGPMVVLHDGLALQSRRLGTRSAGLADAPFEDLTLVVDGSGQVESQDDWCAAGGAGAASCNYGCNMGVIAITMGDTCGVTCREGYYACCGCNWLNLASCNCVKEPIFPMTPTDDIDW